MTQRERMSAGSARMSRRVAVAVMSLSTLICLAQAAGDRKVDVGGFKLHVRMGGPAPEAGSQMPAVVFEAGVGEDMGTWSDVQPQVSQFARTVMYDRAGLGTSEPSQQPRTMPEMARELHALLHAIPVAPPYVLVGHSLGGTLVQVFAHAYPQEVAGLVLVDPEDGELIRQLHSHMSAAEWDAREKAVNQVLGSAPAAVKAEMDAVMQNPHAEPVLPLQRVPVVLLTGTKKNPEFPGNPLEQDLKLAIQNELLAKIPNSKHVLVPNSRHYIQDDAPALVVQAIREVTDAASAAHRH